jgi:hypothetical protein
MVISWNVMMQVKSRVYDPIALLQVERNLLGVKETLRKFPIYFGDRNNRTCR